MRAADAIWGAFRVACLSALLLADFRVEASDCDPEEFDPADALSLLHVGTKLVLRGRAEAATASKMASASDVIAASAAGAVPAVAATEEDVKSVRTLLLQAGGDPLAAAAAATSSDSIAAISEAEPPVKMMTLSEATARLGDKVAEGVSEVGAGLGEKVTEGVSEVGAGVQQAAQAAEGLASAARQVAEEQMRKIPEEKEEATIVPATSAPRLQRIRASSVFEVMPPSAARLPEQGAALWASVVTEPILRVVVVLVLLMCLVLHSKDAKYRRRGSAGRAAWGSSRSAWHDFRQPSGP